MALITLGIEGSKKEMGLALLKRKELLTEELLANPKDFFPVLSQMLNRMKLKKKDIDLISVNTGPGSFTSLRVSLTIARTLAQLGSYAVVGVNSLEILSENFRMAQLQNFYTGNSPYIIPIMDARRKRVYASIFFHTKPIEENLDIEPEELLTKIQKLEGLKVLLGTGATLYSSIWLSSQKKQVVVLPSLYNQPKAQCTAVIGRRKYLKKGDQSYWNILPNYIRNTYS